MPTKTNTDKIDELAREQASFGATIKSEMARFEKQLDRHTVQIDKLQDTCTQVLARLAAIEQRLSHIDKQMDEIRTRRWQIYVLVLGWLFSTILAVLAFVMRR
jgi:hypothetical protein